MNLPDLARRLKFGGHFLLIIWISRKFASALLADQRRCVELTCGFVSSGGDGVNSPDRPYDESDIEGAPPKISLQ